MAKYISADQLIGKTRLELTQIETEGLNAKILRSWNISNRSDR